jgi:hypothetical protein
MVAVFVGYEDAQMSSKFSPVRRFNSLSHAVGFAADGAQQAESVGGDQRRCASTSRNALSFGLPAYWLREIADRDDTPPVHLRAAALAAARQERHSGEEAVVLSCKPQRVFQ